MKRHTIIFFLLFITGGNAFAQLGKYLFDGNTCPAENLTSPNPSGGSFSPIIRTNISPNCTSGYLRSNEWNPTLIWDYSEYVQFCLTSTGIGSLTFSTANYINLNVKVQANNLNDDSVRVQYKMDAGPWITMGTKGLTTSFTSLIFYFPSSITSIPGGDIEFRIYAKGIAQGTSPDNYTVTFNYITLTGNICPNLSTGFITGAPFCQGSSVSIPYTKTCGTFLSGNKFIAQLSDATGSFLNAANLDSVVSTTSGTINAIIPVSIVPGAGYRIRVVSTNPVLEGSDNGINLTLTGPAIFTGSIAGSPFPQGAAVTVPFSICGNFNSGNKFIAQLSDASGSFSVFTNLDSIVSTSGGSINTVIPASTSIGSLYRIRVVSTNPSVNGSDNGANLTVIYPVNPPPPTMIWDATYSSTGGAQDVAIDGDGNVYTTGYDNQSFVTVKYSPDGTQLWARIYDVSSGMDWPTNILVDAGKNVFVAGTSNVIGANEDIILVKYDTYGNLLWSKQYNGPANGHDRTGMRELSNLTTKSMCLDAAGHIYICGRSQGIGTGFDFVTLKYDGITGNVLWEQRYNNPGNLDDRAYAVTTDNVFVYVTGGGLEFTTIKYDLNGSIQPGWPVFTNLGSEAFDIITDANGNVYVTGAAYGSPMYDIRTVKYNSSGTQIWTRLYNGPGNDLDYGTRIVVDMNGDVIVGGVQTGDWSTTAGYDMIVLKYKGDGSLVTPVWKYVYDNSTIPTFTSHEMIYDMTIDSQGDVYITGSPFTTIKLYNATGTEVWKADHSGSTNYSITLNNSASDIYVAGLGSYLTIRYGQEIATPVQMSDFHARYKDGSVILEWKTENESENLDFILERGGENFVFEELDQIEGYGGSGNTQYLFTDNRPLQGISYYRLLYKTANTKKYSNPVEVYIPLQEIIRTGEIFPNPSSLPFLNIPIYSETEELLAIEMLNAEGKLIQRKNKEITGGYNLIVMITENLSRGMYFIRITRNNGEIYIQKYTRL